MSADFIVRIIGMAIFSIVGVYVGNGLSLYNPDQQLFYTITFTLVGALFGLILTPYLTTRPIRALRAVLGRLAAETLFSSPDRSGDRPAYRCPACFPALSSTLPLRENHALDWCGSLRLLWRSRISQLARQT